MSTFNPMLAVNIKADQVKHTSMGSIKLEGVRGEFFPEDGLLTRQLKPFNNENMYERFQQIEAFCTKHGIMLEGEFYVHGWNFKRIDSACRKGGQTDALEMLFHVHDCFVPADPTAGFEKRYEYYKWAVTTLKENGCVCVEYCRQTIMKDADQINMAYAWALDHGYEGFVLKRADAPYKFGRSTLTEGYFARMKPEDPFDGVVLDIVERQANLLESEINEKGFQFKRQDKDAKEGMGIAQTAIVYCPALMATMRVQLTRGLKDYEFTEKGPSREALWQKRDQYIGKVVKFVGIPVPGQLPRSPRFDEFREDIEPIYLVHHDSEAVLVTFDTAFADKACKEGCEDVSQARFMQCLNEGYTI